MASLFCGSSGFAYTSWKPAFYPAKLPQKDFLAHYASRLNAVEINYTFRQLPKLPTLESWVQSTPPGFLFIIKMHQRITHIARLKESEFEPLFYRAIDPLRSSRRLGPVLAQLPPNMKKDAGLLEAFLSRKPAELRLAIEFRNTSWFDEEVYTLLEKHGVALCLAESDKLETPERMTSDFGYFRLRKPDYSEEERREIADKAEQLRADGRDVFLFFKHEDTPDGALHAEWILQHGQAS